MKGEKPVSISEGGPVSAFSTIDQPFEGVHRIAVLRGGGIGDLLFAMPAMDALAAAYPDAELILLGSPVHAELLRGRASSVSRVEVLPVARGVREVPGERPDAARIADFHGRVRHGGPLDLGVQLHGGGRNSNPFLLALDPRHSVGTATEDAPQLERTMRYVYYQHEVVRGLEVAALAGAEPVVLEPRLSVTAAERQAVAGHVPTDGRPFAVVHPGASDPRRRWPAERFARVIEGLLDAGASVSLIGDVGDTALGERIAQKVHAMVPGSTERVSVLAGTMTLGEGLALLASADVVVANDSGPRHLAQAVGASTVGIFWFGNVVNAAPLARGRHRVHLSFTVRCPVCRVDVTQVGWRAERCEHDVSFVDDVDVAPVLADALELMATSSLRSGTREVPAPHSHLAG
jgi:ADP-heptose:LPS heptosyltransferase